VARGANSGKPENTGGAKNSCYAGGPARPASAELTERLFPQPSHELTFWPGRIGRRGRKVAGTDGGRKAQEQKGRGSDGLTRLIFVSDCRGRSIGGRGPLRTSLKEGRSHRPGWTLQPARRDINGLWLTKRFLDPAWAQFCRSPQGQSGPLASKLVGWKSITPQGADQPHQAPYSGPVTRKHLTFLPPSSLSFILPPLTCDSSSLFSTLVP